MGRFGRAGTVGGIKQHMEKAEPCEELHFGE